MLAGSAENSARSSGSDKSSDNEGSSHTVTKKRKYRVIKNGVYCLVLASQQAAIKQGWQRRNSQKEAPTKSHRIQVKSDNRMLNLVGKEGASVFHLQQRIPK